MSKNIYILFISFLLTSSVFGQFVGKDDLSVALFYLQKNELDSAKTYIDKASTSVELKAVAKTWYYKGFIYKELYKVKDKNIKSFSLREVSIRSFEAMKTIVGAEDFSASSAKILKYVASTLYNDAARMLNAEEYNDAIDYYSLFREAMLLVDANADLSARDVQFKLALASKLNRPEEGKLEVDSVRAYQVRSIYLEVLEIDSNNSGANYNLGILYYNEAAEIINNMDYEMDIISLNIVQEHCLEIFLKSLPFMEKSYELGYNRRETLIGLSNIYYGLNDIEKSQLYKKELQDIDDVE